MLLIACSDSSDFAGSNGRKKSPATEVTPKTPDEVDEPAQPEEEPVEDQSQDASKAEPAPPVSAAPENAVTKGSFTAWADPPRPAPRQAYWIHVQVRLPSNTTSYQVSDISGRLVGTDGYRRGVGRDSKGPLDGAVVPWWIDASGVPQDQFQFNGTTATIAIWIPGAKQLVRDTINISSDLLKESQALEIVFQ